MTDTAANPETTESRPTFKSFEESTKEDWEQIIPHLAVSQAMVADRVINLMEALEHDHGGFPVHRLEHSLQTATRAERDGQDDEYVFCALIHDIGDTLSPYDHPAIAASIVKPHVSPANHWMVQNHGVFQGYYFWDYIGLDSQAREEFRGHEFFDHTEEFCAKYDQLAFDDSYKSNPLEHYIPLIREILTP